MSQFNCDVPFSADFGAIIEPLSILNLDITSSLGLACSIDNFDYVDTLVGVTLGPLFFVAFLVVIFGLEVAFRKYKTKRLDAKLKDSKFYAVPEDLVQMFSNREIQVFRRTFSYFDEDTCGTADFADFDLFEAKAELSFGDYMYAIQRARAEDRQSELSDFIGATEVKANARQGEYIIFTLMLFSFIILIGTSSTIFEYFQCESFEEIQPAVSYLVRDYSLNCGSSRYRSFVAYAVAMLFVYPLG